MKKIIISTIGFLIFTFGLYSEEKMCKVQVCNKIERFSLNIWSHMKDNMGESCMDVVVEKQDAVVDKIIASESRWYQGSQINPTKKSVSRVKKVYSCN